MDGMFLGIVSLFQEIFTEVTDPPLYPTVIYPPPILIPATTPIVTNITEETVVILFVEEEDTVRRVVATSLIRGSSSREPEYPSNQPARPLKMHHTTATGLVVTALLVLILVALFALCFFLRKYCRCAYGMHYNYSYGKTPKGHVLVPGDDQLEAGEYRSNSHMNIHDSAVNLNSRKESEVRLLARPQTPVQQRPPRPAVPPSSNRSTLQRQHAGGVAAEHRPLLASDTGSLSVQPTGLYPHVEPAAVPRGQAMDEKQIPKVAEVDG